MRPSDQDRHDNSRRSRFIRRVGIGWFGIPAAILGSFVTYQWLYLPRFGTYVHPIFFLQLAVSLAIVGVLGGYFFGSALWDITEGKRIK